MYLTLPGDKSFNKTWAVIEGDVCCIVRLHTGGWGLNFWKIKWLSYLVIVHVTEGKGFYQGWRFPKWNNFMCDPIKLTLIFRICEFSYHWSIQLYQLHCYFSWNVITSIYQQDRPYCMCLSLLKWPQELKVPIPRNLLCFSKQMFNLLNVFNFFLYRKGWVTLICKPFKRWVTVFPTLQQLLRKHSYKLEKRAATVTGETHPEEMSTENVPMLTDAAPLSGS